MKTFGIYLGSFNPFHVGHLDVLKRAQADFDTVIVGQGYKLGKEAPHTPRGVEGIGWERFLFGSQFFQYLGLAAEFVNQFVDANPDKRFFIIRGVRNEADKQDALALLFWINQSLRTPICLKTYAAKEEFQYVSSSVLRELANYDTALVSKFLPNA